MAARMTITPDTVREHEVTITATQLVVKYDWRVSLGLWLISLGCLLSGVEFFKEDAPRPTDDTTG